MTLVCRWRTWTLIICHFSVLLTKNLAFKAAPRLWSLSWPSVIFWVPTMCLALCLELERVIHNHYCELIIKWKYLNNTEQNKNCKKIYSQCVPLFSLRQWNARQIERPSIWVYYFEENNVLWWNKRRGKFILTRRLRVGRGEEILLALKNECECNGRRRRRPWRWKKQLEYRLGSECATLSDVKESLPLSTGFTRIIVEDEGVKVSWSPSQRHEMTKWSLHSISWIIGRLMKSGVIYSLHCFWKIILRLVQRMNLGDETEKRTIG